LKRKHSCEHHNKRKAMQKAIGMVLPAELCLVMCGMFHADLCNVARELKLAALPTFERVFLCRCS